MLCVLHLWVFALLQPPDASQQAAIIDRMREYADGYAQSVPNFVCTQTTTHFESGSKKIHWRKGDTVEAELTYSEGQEHQQIRTLNKQPVHFRVRPWRWALTTEGEFGASLRQLFAPGSDTHFEWQRWDEVQGHRVAVFSYRIEKKNSTKRLTVFGVETILGYHGFVWGDPETGQVWRTTDVADEIPEEFQADKLETAIDYALAPIAATSYLLPRTAVTVETRPKQLIKNENVYSDYRKFGANSTISFGDTPAQEAAH